MMESLKKYLEETSDEKILEDWNKSSYLDNIGPTAEDFLNNNNMNQATQIVTIKSFSPMFKEGEEAHSIQIVNVEEHLFDIVAQKGLYQIGEKALFISPDFCLSDILLFSDFIAPESNPNKSKLGKQNRVKAIKFGFTDTKGNKVYSNGILIPLTAIQEYPSLYIHLNNPESNLDEVLGITKYEEPEGKKTGDSKGYLPIGMYKTDETNFNNNYKQLESLLPCNMVGSVKIDGSSCSIYYKSENEFGICSRQLEKKLFTTNYIGWRTHFNKDETGILHGMGYLNETTNEFVLNKNWDEYILENGVETEDSLAKDDWVELGYSILLKLQEYKKPLAIRSEVYGQGLKGSGNKNNPHSKLPKSISIYGIDDYSTGIAIPLSTKEVNKILGDLDLLHLYVPIITIQEFKTIQDIVDFSKDYFKTNLIEGIVWRTYESNSYSGKFMSDDYDSLK